MEKSSKISVKKRHKQTSCYTELRLSLPIPKYLCSEICESRRSNNKPIIYCFGNNVITFYFTVIIPESFFNSLVFLYLLTIRVPIIEKFHVYKNYSI
jgi:hypothetical protein